MSRPSGNVLDGDRKEASCNANNHEIAEAQAAKRLILRV
jgi:hypothetical protein